MRTTPSSASPRPSPLSSRAGAGRTLPDLLSSKGLALAFFALVAATCTVPEARPARWQAPGTDREEGVGDDYHGTWIPDPYRWLEDQDGERTAAWTKLQNAATEAYLASAPAREGLRERLAQLFDYARVSAPRRAGEWWIFSKNDGLQNQAIVYRAKKLGEAGEVLLDPNTFSADGTAALAGLTFTRDGKLAAYAISKSGSDWREWRVIEVATGRTLPDTVSWTKFTTATWLPDGSGFLYSRFPKPEAGKTFESANRQATYYLHKLGTEQSADVVVYEDKAHPERYAQATLSDDGSFLIFTISSGTDARNRVSVLDVAQIGVAQPKVVFGELTASYRFLGNDGRVAYFLTDDGAPRRRVIAVDVDDPKKEKRAIADAEGAPRDSAELDAAEEKKRAEKAGVDTTEYVEEWNTLIPEEADTLETAKIVGERFVLTYMRDAHHVVVTTKLDGTDRKPVKLPGLGSVSGMGGKRKDMESFFTFQSFIAAPSVYRLDLGTGGVSLHHRPRLDFEPENFVARQVAFQSADGTRVPMFLVHKRGLKLDGSNPTYLYGYGGFNISLKPTFRPDRIAWLEQGGLYAQPSLRGGGEFGRDWHEAGMRKKKQNVFDDFVAAADYLIRNQYTRPDRLAIGGGSNGGLLVGAALTQRPELFGAAVPEVGVMDMLRFHKFTIGHAWVPEYGSSEDPEMFPVLRAYSPLHNLQAGTRYPATMVMTGDHDDRVLPGHSYKFAAALQRAQGGTAPILLRVARKAGHGAGKPTKMRIAEAADRWAFVLKALGLNEGL